MKGLALSATADAGTLPDARFGERPGPPRHPLLVSGTHAYRDGECL